jgi:hypothetical protein
MSEITITIQQSTFERLQRHARPLIDSSDAVINKAVDALEWIAQERPTAARAEVSSGTRSIDPRALPRLTHTKLLEAFIEGQPIAKANWNRLLDQILILAMKRVGSFEKLRQACPVNVVKGRKEDDGYSYLREIDISVQGQDANGACRAIATAAQGLGIAIDITFMWRLKEAAAHPGERGRLLLNSKSNKTNKAA